MAQEDLQNVGTEAQELSDGTLVTRIQTGSIPLFGTSWGGGSNFYSGDNVSSTTLRVHTDLFEFKDASGEYDPVGNFALEMQAQPPGFLSFKINGELVNISDLIASGNVVLGRACAECQ